MSCHVMSCARNADVRPPETRSLIAAPCNLGANSVVLRYVNFIGASLRVASFPGSPSFRAIIPRMTFDPPEGKAEGEPGRFCHMTSVMLRHPYIRYRRDPTSRLYLMYG